MTLLYDTRLIPGHPIEPLRWTAARFALILSHVGREYRQSIGAWELAERS